jgi:beta-xylosidase
LIVIFVDKIDNFLQFIEKRVMNEIFYEFNEIKSQADLLSKNNIEMILHFLAKIENNLILYETKQIIVKTKDCNCFAEIDKSSRSIIGFSKR